MLGSDPLIDIAVLKINATGQPAATLARLGSPADLRAGVPPTRVGDWVLAIGERAGPGP